MVALVIALALFFVIAIVIIIVVVIVIIIVVIIVIILIIVIVIEAVGQFRDEWKHLLAAERLGYKRRKMESLLKQIHWLSWPIARVGFLLLESENWSVGPMTRDWLTNRYVGWRESLLVEQANHYLRFHTEKETPHRLSPVAVRFWKTVPLQYHLHPKSSSLR